MAKNNWSSDAFKKAQNLLSRGYNDKDTFEAATTLSKDDAKELARSMKLDTGVTGYGNTPFDDNQASMNAYFPSMNQDYQAETIPLSNDPYEMSPISRGNEQQGPRPGSEDYYIQNKREQILNGSYTPTTNEKNDPWIITKFMEDTKPQKNKYNMLDRVTDAWTNANTSREYFRNKGIEEARERASSTGTTMDDLKKLGSSLNPIQEAGAGIKEDFMDLFKKKEDKLKVADGMYDATDYMDFLKNKEDFRAEAYDPTAKKGQLRGKEKHLTIGYGHNGSDVQEGVILNERQATNILRNDVEIRLEEIQKAIPKFETLPIEARKHLLGSWFRGSIKPTHKTVKLLNAGKYLEASKEFLDNDEYRDKDTLPGVKKRMRATANAIRKLK